MTPVPLLAESAGIKSVAIPHLASQYGLGGSRWAEQFIYGFGAMGTFPQAGLYSRIGKMADPESPDFPISVAASRFCTRAKESGWPHADTLRNEAMEKAGKGLAGPPQKLAPSGGLLWLGGGSR